MSDLPSDLAGGIGTLYLVRSLNIYLRFSTQSFRMRTIPTTENSHMKNLAVMHQSIPSTNIPRATPGVLHSTAARGPGFILDDLLRGPSFCISIKLRLVQ